MIRNRSQVSKWGAVLAVASLSLGLGCGTTNGLDDALNPQFLSVIGTPVSPVVPGSESFVVVRVINMTPQSVFFRISVKAGESNTATSFTSSTYADGDMAFVFSCPVTEIGLGDVDDESVNGVYIIFEDNTRLEVPNLSRTLKTGNDFFCGDVVVFGVHEDPTTVTGYSISYGVVDGSTQGTEFTGPDTFKILTRELAELKSIGITPVEDASTED